ncbi:hypothetical protein L4D06_17330 [Enterovibrio makurazakiensis]|uniref:Uncharacterized protein n=1 Tax=Enterovibrio gelatinilyticus TaxID=2899819 RepID=A0ABT5R194_9GAMM|nr:hypothetical protein [Enterovibrio sp. ZSDZ42]MDD1793526.1 hypothetical protein [Enterovibrio sp. ZSDZ42]
MNIGNVGQSQYVYAKPSPVNAEAKANQAQTSEGANQSYAQVAKGVTDAKTVNQATATEGKVPASSDVEAFTYGALGMDHPDEVKTNDDGAYTAGQVLSAIGTIGGILAILV